MSNTIDPTRRHTAIHNDDPSLDAQRSAPRSPAKTAEKEPDWDSLPDYAGLAAKAPGRGHHIMSSSMSAREPSTATYDPTAMFMPPKAQSQTVAPAESEWGKIQTDNPNEIGTHTTTFTAAQLVPMIKAKWPQLSDEGARTLAAQCAIECGRGGSNCFNFNVGNVKAGPNEPHMYLHHVWEVTSESDAAKMVANAHGLAHIATPEEMKAHGWTCDPGQSIVIFEPPHAQCRFKAYTSMDEGVTRWVARHQAIAVKDPNYLGALNRGDVPSVAHALKKVGYYSQTEPKYLSGMQREKAFIDQTLPKS